jgi:hypothetical protein
VWLQITLLFAIAAGADAAKKTPEVATASANKNLPLMDSSLEADSDASGLAQRIARQTVNTGDRPFLFHGAAQNRKPDPLPLQSADGRVRLPDPYWGVIRPDG